MKKPSIILFLVEGKSDKIALELGVSSLFETAFHKYTVIFCTMKKSIDKTGGDITTEKGVCSSNIQSKIKEWFIEPLLQTESLELDDIAQIIQVVDMDGAYLNDDCIVNYISKDRPRNAIFYNAKNGVIETNCIQKTIFRNKQKQENLECLCSCSVIGIEFGDRIIPYKVFYFSSNLEHFTINDANFKGSKELTAMEFCESYESFGESFRHKFLSDPASLGKLGYKVSWEKIKEDSNSVKRYTNFDYLIKMLTEQNKAIPIT